MSNSTLYPKVSKTEAVKKFLELKHSGRWQELMNEAAELDRLAVPLYKERLCSNPFYKAREHDAPFWSAYVGSRIVEARMLVERAKAASTDVEKMRSE